MSRRRRPETEKGKENRRGGEEKSAERVESAPTDVGFPRTGKRRFASRRSAHAPKRRVASKWRKRGEKQPHRGGLIKPRPPASLGKPRARSFPCLSELRARAPADGSLAGEGLGAPLHSGLYRATGGAPPVSAGRICEPTACPSPRNNSLLSELFSARERDDTGTGTRRRVLVGRPRRPAIHNGSYARAPLAFTREMEARRSLFTVCLIFTHPRAHTPPHVCAATLARHGSRATPHTSIDELRPCGARLVSSGCRPP